MMIVDTEEGTIAAAATGWCLPSSFVGGGPFLQCREATNYGCADAYHTD